MYSYVKDGDNLSSERISLINSKITLWAQGGSTVSSRYPFQFVLPSQLPPSFYHSSLHTDGVINTDGIIKYFTEVIGKRGLFRFDHYIRQVFPVVPAASPSDISNKTLLVGGWNQSWESFEIENYVRTWPWEGYSYVYAEVCNVPFFLLNDNTYQMIISLHSSPFLPCLRSLFPHPFHSAFRLLPQQSH